MLNILFDLLYIFFEIVRTYVTLYSMHAGMEKIGFQYFADSQEFADFAVLFRNFTGISSGIYDAEGRQIKTVFTAADESPLCRIIYYCLLYTSPSPRDRTRSRMPSSA